MNALLASFERPHLFLVCCVCSVPLYIMTGKVFYNDFDDFLEGLRLFFQPDWLSALRGEWGEDQWQSLKLVAYVVICIGLAGAVYKLAKMVF